MAGKIWAALSPERVQVDAGGQPATIVVGVQNMAAEVDHLTLEVEGLDPAWYTFSGTILQLFPSERGQAQLRFEVPSRSDVRSGSYPFTVRVRSRIDPGEAVTAQGILEVKPQHVYRFDVLPKRSVGRKGRFRAVIQNSGTADVDVQLQGKDPEALCRFKFRNEFPRTVPGAENTIPFTVKPRRSGLVGDPKTFNLTISAVSDGGAETKAVTAQLVHQPRFRSLGPLVKLTLLAIVAVALLTAFVWPAWLQIPALDDAKQRLLSLIPVGQQAGPDGPPVFLEGFKLMHDARPDLVGDPIENVRHDSKGNGYQNSTKGTLFWYKPTNTDYFFSREGVYVSRAGRVQQMEPR